MAVNQYSLAPNMEFINTYTPIDFGNLFRITQQLLELVNLATKDFADKVQLYSSFKSPSSVDTKRYYDLTVNRDDIKSEIQKMAENSDYIKDSANRSKFQSLLNTIDFSQLADIKQSSENAAILLKNIDTLKMNNRFNPEWMIDEKGNKIDLANWDTKERGILNYTSPIPYMTDKELSDPYFKNLSKGLIGHEYKNGLRYNVIGNKQEDLLLVAKANVDDIIGTPSGQMYYRLFLQKNNGDTIKAKEDMISMIANSLKDRLIRPLYQIDEGYLKLMEMANRRQMALDKLAAKGSDGGGIKNLTGNLQQSTGLNMLSKFGGLTTQLTEDIYYGRADNNTTETAVKNILQNLRNQFHSNTGQRLGKSVVGYKNAADNVLVSVTDNISPEADELLMKEGGVVKRDGLNYAQSTGKMVLARDKIFDMMGYGNTNTYLKAATGSKITPINRKSIEANKKFEQLWYNSRLRDVIVEGSGGTITDLRDTYHTRKAYIPLKELKIHGLSLEDAALIGKAVKFGKIKDQYKSVDSEIFDSEGKPLTKDGKYVNTSIRTKIDDSEIYIERDALYPIESDPRRESVKARNAQYNKKMGIGSKNVYNQMELDEE